MVLQQKMRLEDECAVTQEDKLNDAIQANYEYLWDAIRTYEKYPFTTENGKRIRYKIDGNSICIGNVRISREIIESLYFKSRKLQMKRGCVQEIEFLQYGGSAELYAIFLRFGVCEKESGRIDFS